MLQVQPDSEGSFENDDNCHAMMMLLAHTICSVRMPEDDDMSTYRCLLIFSLV